LAHHFSGPVILFEFVVEFVAVILFLLLSLWPFCFFLVFFLLSGLQESNFLFILGRRPVFDVLLALSLRSFLLFLQFGFAIVVDVDVVILLSSYFKVDILSSEHFAIEVLYVFN
jgi:hypothetical protein